MSKKTEFEQKLTDHQSFDKYLEMVTLDLARRFEGQHSRDFSDYWDGLVLQLPENELYLDVLPLFHRKYLSNLYQPADNSPDFELLVEACSIYAAAAKRAYDRADSSAAWILLIESMQLLNKVNQIEDLRYRLKLKAEKSSVALANGDIHGQRVRYRIIALLHTNSQKRTNKFESVKAAIEHIDDEIACFIDNNNLQISHVKLVTNVRSWIKDHPAFRAEITPFLKDGVIKN